MQPDKDEWEAASSSMVDELLADGFSDDAVGTPNSALLDRMISLCIERLEEHGGGVMRKCDLGVFLKSRVGGEYRRGWLKLVLDTLKERRLVRTTAWEVMLTSASKPNDGMIAAAGAEVAPLSSSSSKKRWCHFFDCCRYLVNVEANAKHFDSFKHLCPMGLRCRHVTAHVMGMPMTEETVEHCRRWKHKCPQGSWCVYFADVQQHKDHFNVFTHRDFHSHGYGKNDCAFSAAMPHV